MRLLALVLFGVPLAVAAITEAARGNPLAWGMAFGTAVPLALAGFVLMAPVKRVPQVPQMTDLRRAYPSEAPTMVAKPPPTIASEARKARGIQ